MSREWKPGDVAATDYQGYKSRAFVVEGRACPLTHPEAAHWHGQGGGWNPLDDRAASYRPLVVIDPEDREQVERLWVAMLNVNRANAQAALREFANPPEPKPEVWEHLASRSDDTLTALCGKVWQPAENVTVVGRCPECLELTGSGWVS